MHICMRPAASGGVHASRGSKQRSTSTCTSSSTSTSTSTSSICAQLWPRTREARSRALQSTSGYDEPGAPVVVPVKMGGA